jgi:hypothetical protein
MTIIRVLAAATIAGSVGSLVAVLTAPSASASALPEGTYNFTFDGSKKTTDGKPDPMRTTIVMAGIRSACPPAGCVATALEVGSASQSVIVLPPPNTWVYRENDGQWQGNRPQDYDCNGDKVSGSETQSFQVMPDGTLTGVDTQLQAPCPPVVVPFTAKRRSANLPVVQSGQSPQDPNTA